MRRLGIFLDSSAAMSAPGGDFKPNSLLFSIRLLEQFIPDFLRRNTLGSASVYELRDGICQQIAPVVGNWSSNAHQLVGDVQHRFQQKSTSGSGTASIVNALRVMCCDLGGNDASPNLGFSGSCFSSALLITSAITLVDAADVFGAIEDVAKLGITVDVLSLCGAPHVLEALCQRTGGTLLCPIAPSHTSLLLAQVAQPTWKLANNNNNNNNASPSNKNSNDQKRRNRDKHDGEKTQTMKPVALYHDSNTIPKTCPLCCAPQQFKGFPRSCVSCGLLSLSEVQWRASRAEATASKIVAVPLNIYSGDVVVLNENQQQQQQPVVPVVKCKGICNRGKHSSCVEIKTVFTQQSSNNNTNNIALDDAIRHIPFVLRCLTCKSGFCRTCANVFSTTVKMCPCCSIMLEDV